MIWNKRSVLYLYCGKEVILKRRLFYVFMEGIEVNNVEVLNRFESYDYVIVCKY